MLTCTCTVLGPKGVLYTQVPLYLVPKVSFIHRFHCTWSQRCPLYTGSTVLGPKGVLYTQVPLYLVPKVSFIHRFHCTWSQRCPLYTGSINCNFYKELEVLLEHMRTPCSPACGLDIAIYGHFRINSYVLYIVIQRQCNHACMHLKEYVRSCENECRYIIYITSF